MGTELGNPWKNSATVTSRARSDFGAPRSVTGSRKSGRAMRLDRDQRHLRSGLGGRQSRNSDREIFRIRMARGSPMIAVSAGSTTSVSEAARISSIVARRAGGPPFSRPFALGMGRDLLGGGARLAEDQTEVVGPGVDRREQRRRER